MSSLSSARESSPRSLEMFSSKETQESRSFEDMDRQLAQQLEAEMANSSDQNNNAETTLIDPLHRYSIQELVSVLGDRNNHSVILDDELERRVRDFQLAQSKRKHKEGETSKWGIFGMYNHLSNVRIDLEWAEDAAYRRNNNKPYLTWSDFNAQRKKGINRPFFTYILIAICTIMMVVEFAVNDFTMEPLSVNPMLGVSKETLIATGGRDTDRIQDGEWFRIITALFLHAGLIHYCINMVVLYFIGKGVEQSHGPIHAMVLFFVPGIGGNILSAIFLPEFVSVGASGGIFGLIGGCVADIWLNWDLLFIKCSDETEKQVIVRNTVAVVVLVVEILINILIGLVCPFVDNWAHLGGFVYGICCAFSTLEPLTVGFFGVNTSVWEKFKLVFAKFFGLILCVFLIIASLVYLATADPGDNPCGGCRYISCVPFPFFAEDKWWYCDDCDFTTARLEQEENSGRYISVELNCPDGNIVEILGNDPKVSPDSLGSHSEVRQKLPSYCRDFCESVFD